MKLRYTRQARDDLAEIHEFISRRNPAAAANVIFLIRRTAEALIPNPQIGRPGRVAGTRELAVVRYPFVVVYRALGDEIHVLSVIHTARQWPAGFEET
jgi:addiction module toxin, RelE/StbE family